MQKVTLIVAAGLMALILICGPALAAEEQMCIPMGEITLSPLAQEAQRTEVTFPHAVHFSYSCQQCHHKWDRETPIVGCGTSGCHDLAELPKDDQGHVTKDAQLKIRYYKNAYHSKCIGCHKEIKQRNQKAETMQLPGGGSISPTGPTGCIQCHPAE
jgi:hypothetical protein